MRRSTTRSVQRARFTYSAKDMLVVSAAMVGALLVALLAMSHGMLVAVGVASFVTGWTMRKSDFAWRPVARSGFGRRRVLRSGYRAPGQHAVVPSGRPI